MDALSLGASDYPQAQYGSGAADRGDSGRIDSENQSAMAHRWEWLLVAPAGTGASRRRTVPH